MNLSKRINNLYAIKAAALLLMPLLLIIAEGNERASISDYAYSSVSILYVMLITIAGTLFINNSITTGKWYNAVLGVCLLGVALTPHKEYPILHYTFAAWFFAWSVFVMIYYSSAKQRAFKIVAGAVIVLAMLGGLAFNWWSILIGEWIGLVPICVHFIGETYNKID